MKIEPCKIKLPEENREEILKQILAIGKSGGLYIINNHPLGSQNWINITEACMTVYSSHGCCGGSEILHQDFIAKYGPETGAINDYEVGDVRRYGGVEEYSPEKHIKSLAIKRKIVGKVILGKINYQELMLQRDNRGLSKREQDYADRKPVIESEPVKTISYIDEREMTHLPWWMAR